MFILMRTVRIVKNNYLHHWIQTFDHCIEATNLEALGIETKVKCLAQGSDLSLQRLTLPLNYPATLIKVGSLNGIYGIKLLFPAPTGSATESTEIVLMKLAINDTSAEDFF